MPINSRTHIPNGAVNAIGKRASCQSQYERLVGVNHTRTWNNQQPAAIEYLDIARGRIKLLVKFKNDFGWGFEQDLAGFRNGAD